MTGSMPKSESSTPERAVAVAEDAFRRYAPALHRYLLRRIRRGLDVADLSQEIFERLLRVKISDAVRYPQAYLFRIASHVVSDSLTREEQSIVTYDSEAARVAGESGELAVQDASAEVSLTQELEQAIGELPDMHRAVLLLAVRDGLSHREVARKTGLTVSTVGLYVCEARARLRMRLERR